MNGYCDIVIMGDGFGKLASTFTSYADTVKTNLLTREPFGSRSAELRWRYINSKSSLGCTTQGGIEASLLCDTARIQKALNGAPMNVMLILAWKGGLGGASGQIAAVGLNQMYDPHQGDLNYCSYNITERALNGIAIHELGHAFGCPHDFTVGNHVMWYGTNGGCELVGKPFLAAHQTIISDFIDVAKQT